MIKDGLHPEESNETGQTFTFKVLMLESIATAIDALSIGVALPTLSLNPYVSCLIIFLCTFIICLLGHSFGKKLGMLLKDKAMLVGGVVLAFIGIKTLLEHLGVF